MNRNNIWIHVGLAVVLITIAAVLGQIERWKATLSLSNNAERTQIEKRSNDEPIIKKSSPEVLVRFKQGVSLAQIREIAVENNDSLADEIESVSGLTVIDDLDNADAQWVADQYAAMTDTVAYAEPNFKIKLIDPDQTETAKDLLLRLPSKNEETRPNDPQFDEQWALNNFGQESGKERADIDALEAWQTTKGSDEVVVAVLDTGVDFTHIDLRENMWIRPKNVPAYTDDELGEFNDINGYNGTDNISDPMDDNGHGTHCAGIIGAEGDNGEGIAGINWHVKIMPLKFLGRGGFGSVNDAIEAINYAIDRKENGVNVRIISASWGSTQKSKALEDTIRAAGEAGILFVAAAGNDGSSNDKRAHYPSNYDLPNVISVAALDRNDQLAGFSNFGVKSVHIAAPGKDILSTWLGDNYREASGTSMATPYVSGVAALIIANEPEISMEKLRDRILKTADKLDSLDGKVATGGRVCAANALAGRVLNHLQH
ncbi:MAG: S8 family serine peptidase [Chloracidobacterium sp.]|nr:S8 family serine peptidase [Chloracidobacterium sp.]